MTDKKFQVGHHAVAVPERTERMVTVPVRDLEMVANQIHQAHHTDMSGSWRSCPKGTCDRIRQILIEGGAFVAEAGVKVKC